MGTLGNFLWLVAGGFVASLLWCLAGVVMYATVVGIPWGRACFTTANLVLLPFGREAVPERLIAGRHAERETTGRTLGNVVWFVLGGWYLAISHALAGILYCVTFVGIPFGLQHFKLGGLALAPVGKRIVTKGEANLIHAEAAQARLAARRAG